MAAASQSQRQSCWQPLGAQSALEAFGQTCCRLCGAIVSSLFTTATMPRPSAATRAASVTYGMTQSDELTGQQTEPFWHAPALVLDRGTRHRVRVKRLSRRVQELACHAAANPTITAMGRLATACPHAERQAVVSSNSPRHGSARDRMPARGLIRRLCDFELRSEAAHMLSPQTLSRTHLGAGEPAVCRQHGGPVQHQRHGLRHAQLLVALRKRLPRHRAPARTLTQVIGIRNPSCVRYI